MNRKCKHCWTKWNINDILFYWLNAFCDIDCYTDYISYQKQTKSSPKVKNTIRKVSLKKQQRIKEWWSEVEVFKEVEKINNTCWICWATIFEPSSITFPHLLSKW